MKNIIRIAPAENSTPDVVKALLNAKDDTELIFEDAEYHFFSDGAYERFFAPTNNANGVKRIVFPIIGKRGIAVRGNGARFLFHSRMFPFIVSESADVILENFSIDFSFPRYAVGDVVESDGRGLTLRIDRAEYPYIVEDSHLAFRAGDELRSTAQKKFFLNGLPGSSCPAAYLVAGDTEDPLTNLPVGVIRTDAYDLGGDRVRLEYRAGTFTREYIAGQTLLISNDENRENDVIFLEKSRDTVLRGINIFRGAGMGVIAQLCTNISVENMNIGVPEWRSEPVSITADAFHFVHCDGNIVIRNCDVSDTLDDAVNIHGIYTRVTEVTGSRTVDVQLGHHEQYGFDPYMPGDTLHVIGESGIKGVAVVSDSALSADGKVIQLTFESDITDIICEGDYIESRGRTPEILLEGNSMTRCPAVLLSSPRKTVVKGNTFELTVSVIMMDSMKYWYEAGTVENVLIEGNIFRTKGTAIAAIIRGDEPVVRRHRGIKVIGNEVAGGGRLMEAAHVDGLTISGGGEVALHDCINVSGVTE